MCKTVHWEFIRVKGKPWIIWQKLSPANSLLEIKCFAVFFCRNLFKMFCKQSMIKSLTRESCIFCICLLPNFIKSFIWWSSLQIQEDKYVDYPSPCDIFGEYLCENFKYILFLILIDIWRFLKDLQILVLPYKSRK